MNIKYVTVKRNLPCAELVQQFFFIVFVKMQYTFNNINKISIKNIIVCVKIRLVFEFLKHAFIKKFNC